MQTLELKAVDKSFAQHAVLRQLDLCIAPGESVAILGPSGCGKSTILKLAAGLELPDQGQVWVQGRVLAQLAEAERARMRARVLGQVFQFFELFETLSVRDNLLLPLKLGGQAVPAGAPEQLLERLGIAALAPRFPDTLSGGEQQRVAIARALLHKPALVLADEPTGNLDEANAKIVGDLLFDLSREQGSALLLVTHAPQLAARADRVLYLRAGALVG